MSHHKSGYPFGYLLPSYFIFLHSFSLSSLNFCSFLLISSHSSLSFSAQLTRHTIYLYYALVTLSSSRWWKNIPINHPMNSCLSFLWEHITHSLVHFDGNRVIEHENEGKNSKTLFTSFLLLSLLMRVCVLNVSSCSSSSSYSHMSERWVQFIKFTIESLDVSDVNQCAIVKVFNVRLQEDEKSGKRKTTAKRQ